MKRLTQQEFLGRANQLHNYKYDYTKSAFTTLQEKIVVVCPQHGEFSVQASNHVKVHKHYKPCGCPKCGQALVKRRNRAGRLSKEEFVNRAKEIHEDKYTYPGQYRGMNHRVKIRCASHGIFLQQGSNHLRGTGCPKCKNSRGQTLIAKSLRRFGIEYKVEYTFEECVGLNGGLLKYDFWLPAYRTLIEFDGEQHFKPIRFHRKMSLQTAQEMFERTKQHDDIKNRFAQIKEMRLLRIPFTKRKEIPALLKSTFNQASDNAE